MPHAETCGSSKFNLVELCVSIGALVVGASFSGCTGVVESDVRNDVGSGNSTGTSTSASPGAGNGTGGGPTSGGGASPTSGGGAAGAAGGAVDPTYVPPPVATPTLSRLSTLQWANSIRDLLKLTAPGNLDKALRLDAVVRFDNEADSLFVDQTMRDNLQSEAERLAALVTSDPKAIARLVPTTAPTDLTGKATAYIKDFGRRAYRRPLADAEVQDYLTLFNQGPTLTTGMTAFDAGMRVTLEAFLQSPNFIYRTGFGGAAVLGRARLTAYEVAANLSFALTNYPPDSTLSAAADNGALQSSTALEAQVARLLPTDPAKLAVNRFFFQYFGLGQYDTLQKDAAVAPNFVDGIGLLMDQEGQHLLQYLFEQNLGLREIFTTPVGFVTAPLAKLYGLPGTFDATTWTQVQFDPAQRPGILTRLGFLSFYGHQALQDSIHRGANINNRILCGKLEKPDIPIPDLPPPDPTLTNRQLIARHTEGCAPTCHKTLINPAGFAFENFDGLGAYHTTEKSQPVDTSGEYAFKEGNKKFSNLAEFAAAIGDSAQAHACYTRTWAADLYQRVPRLSDEALVSALAQRSATEHLSTKAVVVALLTSDAFVTRVEGQQ